MSEQARTSDMCTDPVCMARTDSMIRELKKRFASGCFMLFEPLPQTEEGYKIWEAAHREHGFVTMPEHYQKQSNVWGDHHSSLAMLSKLQFEINSKISQEERDIPEEEVL